MIIRNKQVVCLFVPASVRCGIKSKHWPCRGGQIQVHIDTGIHAYKSGNALTQAHKPSLSELFKRNEKDLKKEQSYVISHFTLH